MPHFAQGTGRPFRSQRQGRALSRFKAFCCSCSLARRGRKQSSLSCWPSRNPNYIFNLRSRSGWSTGSTHCATRPCYDAFADCGRHVPARDTLFIETRDGILTARPLVDVLPAQPTNHQQHLFFAWRQKLVGALMHECVLVPEGLSDVAWLEALQTALELRQDWTIADTDPSRFGTFVGVVPTIDSRVQETFSIVRRVHSRPCVLLDGDAQGQTYFNALRAADPPPACVVLWADGWEIENVVGWIAAAGGGGTLTVLGETLGEEFATGDEFIAYLLENKSYAPTHEAVAVTLMANEACRARAGRLLGSLSDALTGAAPAEGSPFERSADDSTDAMQIYRFAP